MAFLLRNALELEANSFGQVCQEDMAEISFISLDNQITTLGSNTDSADDAAKIASNSGYLTSAGVDLIAGPEFDCTESADGANQYVTITFTLRKGTPGIDEPRDIVEETFTTGVNVRSF
jgi:hypothetical protein